MRELVSTLAWANRVIFDLHVTVSVPFPHRLSVRGHLIDDIAIHAAVRVLCIRKSGGNAPSNFRRDLLPPEKDRVSVRKATKIVVLADVSMLPHHLAIPVIFPQQTSAPAHVLRAFRKHA